MNPNNFIIDGNTMCISEDFDDSLEPYHIVMKDINILIFGFGQRTHSRFNNLIILFPRMTHVKLSYMFDQPLVLSQNITHLDLGYYFNQTIVLMRKIIVLRMSIYFNKIIVLTPKIRALSFDSFNQPITLTKNMRAVHFGPVFNQPFMLSKHIVHLRFGLFFNQPIALTKNVKYLIMLGRSNHSLVLTENIEYFEIVHSTHNIFDNLPNGLDKIICSSCNKISLNNFPNRIIKITPSDSKFKHKSFDGYDDTKKMPINKLNSYFRYISNKYRF